MTFYTAKLYHANYSVTIAVVKTGQIKCATITDKINTLANLLSNTEHMSYVDYVPHTYIHEILHTQGSHIIVYADNSLQVKLGS